MNRSNSYLSLSRRTTREEWAKQWRRARVIHADPYAEPPYRDYDDHHTSVIVFEVLLDSIWVMDPLKRSPAVRLEERRFAIKSREWGDDIPF